MIFNQKVVQLTGRRIALTPPVNFTATPGNEQVSLTWEDPGDATSGGVVVAEWEFTQIVRKVGSPPVNQTDGTIVTISDVKNQYLSEPFVDTGLTNGTTYYYGAFACSKAGAWSDGAFAGAIPVASVALGSLAEGTLVKIKENGTPVEFYVAKQGYEPTLNEPNRVLMVRKDIYSTQQWNSQADAASASAYASSYIDTWCNSTYKSLFSTNVQNMIGSTTYRYTISYSQPTLSTRSSAVFILSVTELGESSSIFNVEGSALSVASLLKPGFLNGVATIQWTRSPVKTTYNKVGVISAVGQLGDVYVDSTAGGARPCFTLPKNTLVDPDMNLIESSDLPLIETPLGDLVEGTLITIQENGAPIEFYVAKQNYEEGLNGAGRVLMVRKDIYDERVWDEAGSQSTNYYSTSSISSWFNSTYKSLLSSEVRQMMGTTKFYYVPGFSTPTSSNLTISTLSRSVFALSSDELGVTANSGGTVLPIYSTLSFVYFNGSPAKQWTRSPDTRDYTSAYYFEGGYRNSWQVWLSAGSRPCFTLPSTALVDGNLALIEEV